MPFKKGQSGNPGGRPEKTFAEQVRIVCAEEDPVRKKRKLRCLAEELYQQAMNGEGWAMCQIADRLDGKPAQESTVTVHRGVQEQTDQEIAARIAELRGTGTSDGDDAPPVDPSQLN